MVGVPGRSRACETCRQRRVKCDLQRPECGPCLKTNNDCQGYGREFIFVNNAAKETETGLATFKPRQYSRKSTVLPIRPTNTESNLRSTVPLLPPELESSACEQHIIGSFWSRYLPNGRLATDEVIKFSLCGWANVATELYVKSPMIRLALCASALGLRGLQDNNPKMLQRSYQMYGKTLLNLNKALIEPDKKPPHVVLTTLKLASLYEIRLGFMDQGSLQFESCCAHIDGKTAFALQNDPDIFSKGDAHRIFADCRFDAALVATLRRKPSPLATPKWKDIPWNSLPKSPRDRLIDIMLDFPIVREQVIIVNNNSNRDEQAIQRKKLIKICWLLLGDFQKWESTWGKEASQFANERANSGPSSDGTSCPLSSEDLAKGHLMLLYWANCIMLCDTLHSEAKKSLEGPETLPKYANPALYCHRVATLLDFFLVNKSGSFMTNIVLIVFAYALEYLSRDEGDGASAEKLMLLRALSSHIDKGAAKFADSLKSFEGKEPYLTISPNRDLLPKTEEAHH